VIVVAVPVKDLTSAKQRLVPRLPPAGRAALARTMLRDVLRALSAAAVDEVWLVTRDAEVQALAAPFGVTIVSEDANRGHTAAVALAQARATAAGCSAFLTVPGDVPCATAAEIRALAAAVADAPAVALVPSRSGLGTNGAALSPPGAMPLTFGEPSFDNHVATARRLGLEPRVLRLPGLGLDVDDGADLDALVAAGPDTESARLVRSWGLADGAGGSLGRPLRQRA
jgi:2-phospho-L-lactate guanylyltransferase